MSERARVQGREITKDDLELVRRLIEQAQDWAIPKMINLLSSPVEHEGRQRLPNRIMRHHQELFIFLDNPSLQPTHNRA
jgi:hypothetical protein